MDTGSREENASKQKAFGFSKSMAGRRMCVILRTTEVV
jgi:hypothetical protein